MTWRSLLPNKTVLLHSALSVSELKDRLFHRLTGKYWVGPVKILGRGRIYTSVERDEIIIEDIIPRHKTVGRAIIADSSGHTTVTIKYTAGDLSSPLFYLLWSAVVIITICFLFMKGLWRHFSISALTGFLCVTAFALMPMMLFRWIGLAYVNKLHKKVVESVTGGASA